MEGEEETVLHFLSEFSMNLEHKRNDYPRISGVMVIKKTEKPYLLKPVFVPSLCRVVHGPTWRGCSSSRELQFSRKWRILWDFDGFLNTFYFIPCFLELILCLTSIILKAFEVSLLIEGFSLSMVLCNSIM